jgi:hypothetical protein
MSPGATPHASYEEAFHGASELGLGFTRSVLGLRKGPMVDAGPHACNQNQWSCS